MKQDCEDYATTKHRWRVVTPDNLAVLLVLTLVSLLLADRLSWFGLKQGSGWNALAAVAILLIALLIGVVWFSVSLLRRRPFQYGMRTLLLLMLCVAIVGGWFSWKMDEARKQREAVIAISRLGDFHDWIDGMPGGFYIMENRIGYKRNMQPLGPVAPRLQDLLGQDFLSDVAAIELFSDFDDNIVVQLNQLPRLGLLELRIPLDPISETHLQRLGQLKHVERIAFVFFIARKREEPKKSIERIQALLPDCELQMGYSSSAWSNMTVISGFREATKAEIEEHGRN